MLSKTSARMAVVLCASLVPACGGSDPSTNETVDTGGEDTGSDVTVADTSDPDTGTDSESDTGEVDSATPDSAPADSTPADSTIPDTATPDTAVADTGAADTSPADVSGDTTLPDTSVAEVAIDVAPTPTCTDMLKNAVETDVDCGGGTCPKCATGKACAVATDCVSGLCTGSVCVAAAPSCTDGAKNGTETDIDCGGSCPPCSAPKACTVASDCKSSTCTAGSCVATCTDTEKNGSESDVDCGGTCGGCADAKTCTANADCKSGSCASGKCIGVFGTGADGVASVTTGVVNLTTSSLVGRTCGDAYAVPVSALTSTTATVGKAPGACLSVGDEVVLINVMGTSLANVNVGAYETLRVASVTGSTVTFAGAKKGFYGSAFGADGDIGLGDAQQMVFLVRVPNYKSLSVSTGAVLTASPWARGDVDTRKPGVLFVRSETTLTVSGSIDMSAAGYAGRQTPATTFIDGHVGYTYAGPGSSGQAAYFGAGGGGRGEACASYGAAGGGGGYGSAGANGSTGCTGNGGGVYGDPTLAMLSHGSAGGSGGNDNVLFDNPVGGEGGAGGGIVVLAGATLTVTGEILSGGGNGNGDPAPGCFGAGTFSCWDYSGPGGGGAGGSILLYGKTATLGTGVKAVGGRGGYGGTTIGGTGGNGRIVVKYGTAISGATTPAALVVGGL